MDAAPIDLLELVAPGWIVEEVGEVRPELQRIVDAVERRLPVTRIPLGAQAIALLCAADAAV